LPIPPLIQTSIFFSRKYDQVYNKLVLELSKNNITLDPKNGIDVDGGGDDSGDTDFNLPQWLSLAAIIVGSILLIMVIFLGIAYRLRVSQ
jgi:hypothetical protein